LLAGRIAHERARGQHVLVRLPTGAERVPVGSGDAVGGGRAGDEQDLVLLGDGGDLQGHAGGGGPSDDLVPFTDQITGGRDRLLGVAGVVDLGHLDRVVADLAGAVGG